jgi:hypothetical protein
MEQIQDVKEFSITERRVGPTAQADEAAEWGSTVYKQLSLFRFLLNEIYFLPIFVHIVASNWQQPTCII